MGEELASVEGDGEFGADGGDAELVFLGDVDGERDTFELAPAGPVHFAEEDGVLAGFDADEISAVGIVAYRGRGGPEE